MNEIVRVIMASAKSYGMSKLVDKTGMTVADIMLYQNVSKGCTGYYMKQAVNVTKSIFNGVKAKL